MKPQLIIRGRWSQRINNPANPPFFNIKGKAIITYGPKSSINTLWYLPVGREGR